MARSIAVCLPPLAQAVLLSPESCHGMMYSGLCASQPLWTFLAMLHVDPGVRLEQVLWMITR